MIRVKAYLGKVVTGGYSAECVGSDFSDDEREFMLAMERFEREHHKPFPDCRDVLAVAKALGYRKVAARSELPYRLATGG